MGEWILANLGNITAFIAASGAVIAAIGAVAAALISLRQVRVSQKQVQLMIDANYDSHRPLVIPTQGLRTYDTEYKWDAMPNLV